MKKLALLATLVLCGAMAHAQQTPQTRSSQQEPDFRPDTYAAIAYSESTGRIGFAWAFETREKAEDRAIKECNAGDARVITWVRNGWCALAIGDNGAYGGEWGASEGEARRKAMNLATYTYGATNARIVCACNSEKEEYYTR